MFAAGIAFVAFLVASVVHKRRQGGFVNAYEASFFSLCLSLPQCSVGTDMDLV